MKHKHKWQFIKDFPCDADNHILSPKDVWRIDGYIAKFVCECGAIKYIREKEIKK